MDGCTQSLLPMVDTGCAAAASDGFIRGKARGRRSLTTGSTTTKRRDGRKHLHPLSPQPIWPSRGVETPPVAPLRFRRRCLGGLLSATKMVTGLLMADAIGSRSRSETYPFRLSPATARSASGFSKLTLILFISPLTVLPSPFLIWCGYCHYNSGLRVSANLYLSSAPRPPTSTVRKTEKYSATRLKAIGVGAAGARRGGRKKRWNCSDEGQKAGVSCYWNLAAPS